MTFGLDTDKLLAFFELGDGDLALAFAEMEGYVAVGLGDRSVWREDACPVMFAGVWRAQERTGAVPFQVKPGLYAYRIRRVRKRDVEARRARGPVPKMAPSMPVIGLRLGLMERVAAEPGRTTAHYAAAAGVDAHHASRELCDLRRRGLLVSCQVTQPDGVRRCSWTVAGAEEVAAPVSGVRVAREVRSGSIRARILDLVRREPGQTTRVYAEAFGIVVNMASSALCELERMGFVVHERRRSDGKREAGRVWLPASSAPEVDVVVQKFRKAVAT